MSGQVIFTVQHCCNDIFQRNSPILADLNTWTLDMRMSWIETKKFNMSKDTEHTKNDKSTCSRKWSEKKMGKDGCFIEIIYILYSNLRREYSDTFALSSAAGEVSQKTTIASISSWGSCGENCREELFGGVLHLWRNRNLIPTHKKLNRCTDHSPSVFLTTFANTTVCETTTR